MATRSAVEDRAAAFEADLIAGPTATVVLERWSGGRVHAEVVARDAGYRRVRLMRGAVVLSEAENRYDPVRLTPAMLAELAHSDASFGAVIAPLGPRREIVAIERIVGDGDFLHVRARVIATDGTLLADVSEHYLPAVLTMLP